MLDVKEKMQSYVKAIYHLKGMAYTVLRYNPGAAKHLNMDLTCDLHNHNKKYNRMGNLRVRPLFVTAEVDSNVCI